MVNIESEKIICQEFVGQFSSAVYFITEWEVITATTQNISTHNLCPLQGAKNIDEEERKARASSGRECDIQLKNAIEGIIIKWAYQVIFKI